MIKDLLSGSLVVGGIVVGVCAWLLLHRRNSSSTYQNILDDSLVKANETLSTDNSSDGRAVGALVTLKRIREGRVAFCLIRRYENGRTTTTTLSGTFNLSICPADIREEMGSKNEILIKKFEL